MAVAGMHARWIWRIKRSAVLLRILSWKDMTRKRGKKGRRRFWCRISIIGLYSLPRIIVDPEDIRLVFSVLGNAIMTTCFEGLLTVFCVLRAQTKSGRKPAPSRRLAL
jgi:hypothetical protein